MADQNGSDNNQKKPFHEKLAKILVSMSIIGLAIADVASLFVGFLLALLFIILFPVLIIFSPLLIVLLPVIIVVVVIIVTPWLITVVLWVHEYVNGKHPIGADHVDKARRKIVEAAEKVKSKVEQLWEDVKKFGQDIF